MSLHYILDGYNVIYQIEELSRGSLEDQRNHLIRLVEQHRPQGSMQNEVTIVFDGRSDVFGSHGSSSVKVLFSKDESADELIKRIVSDADHTANMVVVTNDRDIQYSVRAAGAKAIAVKDFFSKPSTSAPGQTTRDKKNISKILEFKITDEFKKIWIKDKDSQK